MTTEAEKELIAAFEAAGQGHVFAFLDRLDGAGRRRLFEQAASIDLEEFASLAATGTGQGHGNIEPPGDELITLDADASARAEARERGEAEVAAGRVAVVVAAGGQGTRLGSPAPKGMWPVGPASGKSLLQWHAEKVLYWSRKHGRGIPFVLMVSEATQEATKRFLNWHDYFGLDATWVKLACQGSLNPADDEGKLILSAPDRIAASPNGHGGVYRALRDAKLLDLFDDYGITTLSYVQVDNPLIRPIDPVFLGYHTGRSSQISSKSVRKTDPSEKVGVFARVDGRSAVVEYSELTDAQSAATADDGSLLYGQGSIAAHCIDVAFAHEMADRGLPVHRARKKVPIVDAAGQTVTPDAPNGTKFETFLFDAVPLAERALVVETSRAEEFSPIKNAEGTDSPATARRDLEAGFRSWMEGCGEEIPVGALEVPPFSAPDEYEYRLQRNLPGER